MKGLILVLAALGITHTSFAQDTIYVDKLAQWTDKENAVECAVMTKTDKNQFKVEFYTLDGKPKRIENYSPYNANQKIRNGKLVQFYPDGKIRREEFYEHDHCIEGKLWAEDGSELPFTPYYEAPDFPGGPMNFARKLATTLQYPQEAVRNRIQGIVVLQFIIDTDGHIIQPKVVKSVHPMLDEAALTTLKQVAKSKKNVWSPGNIEGEAVQVQYIVPANFRLP